MWQILCDKLQVFCVKAKKGHMKFFGMN